MKKRYDTDDLIYNRFDIIHENEYRTFHYEESGNVYTINLYFHEGVAELDIWGKELPVDVFEEVVSDVFRDRRIHSISLVRCRNNYRDFLGKTNDIRIPLPDNMDELLGRIERRDRATIRRKMKWIDERIDEHEILRYKGEIPNDIVELFFSWKMCSHGKDYNLLPAEYLKKYYVTDALLLRAGKINIAVAFFCQVNKTIYFENFSYNEELKRYSPGLLMYVELMRELIRRKCTWLYLGGGSYVYKKRFGAEEFIAYSGVIYRDEVLDKIDGHLRKNHLHTVAFFGFGVYGHAFLRIAKHLSVKVLYGIDRIADRNEEIRIYRPNDHMPRVDAIFITLKERNDEIEEHLSEKNVPYYYWNDILDKVLKEYLTDNGYS